MNTPILVTGSSGLIGSGLVRALRQSGYCVRELDCRASGSARGDIREKCAVEEALRGCAGVVHLAAMSRVALAEVDPSECWATNVGGTSRVLSAALGHGRPWIVYASSREVYGHVGPLIVDEDRSLVPVNVYGRSKMAAERLVVQSGLPHAILRFSNVYGGLEDHPDRVVPSFARSALRGSPLVVNGRAHAFDFTHLDDVVRGIMAVVHRLHRGDILPPIQLVSGVSTSLETLANLAIGLTRSDSRIVDGPARDFDVSSFCGDPGRAARILDWTARVSLDDGLALFINALASRHTFCQND